MRHDRIRFVPCDLSRETEREVLIEGVSDLCGTPDILVNNAGIGSQGAPSEELPDSMRAAYEVNVVAALHLVQMLAPKMAAARGGTVVNVASILGLVAGGPMGQLGYAASKGALLAATRELGCYWAPRGVRVNAIAPGWIETEMTAPLVEDEPSAKWVRRNTPLGRLGRPDDIDGTILFLVSDASRFCIGTTVTVDGGWTAR